MIKMFADMAYKSNTGPMFRKIKDAARTALQEEAKTVADEAKRLISKKASRERDAITGKSTGRSLPGQLPRSDSGNYRRSIRYTVRPRAMVALVGPTWPSGAHAGMLKWGTKRMAPRLVPSEIALLQSQGKLTRAFQNKI